MAVTPGFGSCAGALTAMAVLVVLRQQYCDQKTDSAGCKLTRGGETKNSRARLGGLDFIENRVQVTQGFLDRQGIHFAPAIFT